VVQFFVNKKDSPEKEKFAESKLKFFLPAAGGGLKFSVGIFAKIG